MTRKIFDSLTDWKKLSSPKPLLLLGARQIGKTWIIKKFGETYYEKVHYFDFSQNNEELSRIFKKNLDPNFILSELELLMEEKINRNSDLIIFDEIQAEPLAIKSLKFFSQSLSGIHLACAGSLLGVGLIKESFPVGQITYLDMYPLSFEEYLEERAGKLILEEYNKAILTKKTSETLHHKLMDILKEYWIIGGMPGVINEYLKFKDHPLEGYQKARKVQQDLLRDYNNDFGKHAGKLNAQHIRAVWENIPLQLASNVDDSVKRFMFKGVLPGKKGYLPLEGPLDWLKQAGLIYKVPICNRAELPLKAFTKPNIFKVQIFDIGLLGAMLELSPATILGKNYGINKGYFTESYVLGELKKTLKGSIYAWNERNSEIEFLLSSFDSLVPLEVKSSHRTKAKSLAQYLSKYKPELAIKLLDQPLEPKTSAALWHIPLYFAGKLTHFIDNSAEGDPG